MAGRPSGATARRLALTALDTVQKSAHARFTDPSAGDRLAQLDHHLSTVRMIVDALFDEDTRHPKGA
jgi:hypothetical protein